MRTHLIILLLITTLFSSCLGRVARSGGAVATIPSEFAPTGPGQDNNGNGIRDDIEDRIRDLTNTPQNEPITDEMLAEYKEALEAAQKPTWKPADIAAMTGLGTDFLASMMSSLFTYAGQNAQSQAEREKWEMLAQSTTPDVETPGGAEGDSSVGFSVAPFGTGNLVEKDKEKLVGKFLHESNGGVYVKFEKARGDEGKFVWKTENLDDPGANGFYTIITRDSNGGGYIDFLYSTGSSIFNGLYTTNVTRCCTKREGASYAQETWNTAENGSTHGFENYIITKIKFTFQTSEDTNVKNELYLLQNGNTLCNEVYCN